MSASVMTRSRAVGRRTRPDGRNPAPWRYVSLSQLKYTTSNFRGMSAKPRKRISLTRSGAWYRVSVSSLFRDAHNCLQPSAPSLEATGTDPAVPLYVVRSSPSPYGFRPVELHFCDACTECRKG